MWDQKWNVVSNMIVGNHWKNAFSEHADQSARSIPIVSRGTKGIPRREKAICDGVLGTEEEGVGLAANCARYADEGSCFYNIFICSRRWTSFQQGQMDIVVASWMSSISFECLPCVNFLVFRMTFFFGFSGSVFVSFRGLWVVVLICNSNCVYLKLLWILFQ